MCAFGLHLIPDLKCLCPLPFCRMISQAANWILRKGCVYRIQSSFKRRHIIPCFVLAFVLAFFEWFTVLSKFVNFMKLFHVYLYDWCFNYKPRGLRGSVSCVAQWHGSLSPVRSPWVQDQLVQTSSPAVSGKIFQQLADGPGYSPGTVDFFPS